MYVFWSMLATVPQSAVVLYGLLRLVMMFTIYGNLEIQELWGAFCCLMAGPEYRRQLKTIMQHRDAAPSIKDQADEAERELEQVRAEFKRKCRGQPVVWRGNEGVFEGAMKARREARLERTNLCNRCKGIPSIKNRALCYDCDREVHRRSFPSWNDDHLGNCACRPCIEAYEERKRALDGDWDWEQELQMRELLEKRKNDPRVPLASVGFIW